MSIAVWAYSKTAPTKVCEDAKLPNAGQLAYPFGTDRGQAGWDLGLLYEHAIDLGTKLMAIKTEKGFIRRLAINSHGDPGLFDIDGTNAATMREPDKFLSVRTMGSTYNTPLGMIKMSLLPTATVLFMGCNLGRGERGSEFLRTLSQTFFRGLTVVAFTTIGVSMHQFRGGGSFCTEPGMRDTDFESAAEGGANEDQRYQGGQLFQYPWASETSPHAKVAKDGLIVKDPEPSTVFGVEYIVGKWDVEIGAWKGVFVFESSHTVYWMDLASPRKHQGSWSTFDGLSWSFADDAPGFKRTFTLSPPLKPVVTGSIYPSGFFKMLKRD